MIIQHPVTTEINNVHNQFVETIEALKKIKMVGNDTCLDDGIGTCGKAGQSVPVGVGQPTLRIDEITVGGTS